MEELSFLEKLQILFDNVIAHPFFLIILMVPMVVMFLERDTTKKEKDVKKIILLIYIIVIAVVLFIGGSTLFDLFDNVVNGFFMTLYFPNFITLVVVIIISAKICLIKVFYKKLTKAIRIINFTGFAIVQTLFCLVLVAIQSNDINIYRENALYSNSDVLTLMQLLMGAFLLQIVAVCVITIINRITEMLDERDNVLQDEKQSGNEAIISEEIKEKRANKNIVLEAKLISLEDLKPKENSDNAVLSMDNEVLTLDDSEKAIDKNSLEETNSLQIDENIIEKVSEAMKMSFSKKKRNVEAAGGTIASANIDQSHIDQKYVTAEIASEMEFPGHMPVRPKLKYLKYDPSINSLIEMRMNEHTPVLHQKLRLKLSNSSGIKENEAAIIDAVLKGMKCTGNTTLVNEIQNEARRYLEYEIDF